MSRRVPMSRLLAGAVVLGLSSCAGARAAVADPGSATATGIARPRAPTSPRPPVRTSLHPAAPTSPHPTGPTSPHSVEPTSPRLAALEKSLASGEAGALERFCSEVEKSGSPLVEPVADTPGFVHLTFLYRSHDDHRVLVVDEFEHAVQRMELRRLTASDVWYRTCRMLDDARFIYRLTIDDPAYPFVDGPEARYPKKLEPDPLNPRRWENAPDVFSLVELPSAPSLAESEPRAGTPKGKLAVFEEAMKSEVLGNARKIYVYTPPGYDPAGPPCKLLVVLGSGYVSMMKVDVLLDNLLADGRIARTVMVIASNVDSATRDREGSCYEPYNRFLVEELVPAVRGRYRVSDRAEDTVVCGASFGGLAATYLGLQHPDVFGNVLSLSGSFWWAPDGDAEDQWLARDLARRSSVTDPSGGTGKPSSLARFFLTIGLLERGTAMRDGLVTMLHASRHMRDVLAARGARVEFLETNGGHDPFQWRVAMEKGLSALLAPE